MRRLVGILVALVLLAGCGGGGGGSAAGGSSNQPQVVHRSVTVPNVAVIAPKQDCTDDCWAACCEAVAKSYGMTQVYDAGWTPATQDWFRMKLYGPQFNCQEANQFKIADALTGAYANTSTNQAMGLVGLTTLGPPPYSQSVFKVVVKSLKEGHPVILGLALANGAGHAVLLSSLNWDEDPQGNVLALTSGTIADPWPYDRWPEPKLPTTLDDSTLGAHSSITAITGIMGAVPAAPSGAPPTPPASKARARQ